MDYSKTTKEKSKLPRAVLFVVLTFLAISFLFPIFLVLMNSFKNKLFISSKPFVFVDASTFVGAENYKAGVNQIDFFHAVGLSFYITILSVAIIILFTSMTAWYVIRVKSAYTKILYYSFVFSMVVPFQMVMFPMSKLANIIHLNSPTGISVLYLGFGAGLSVFMFSGFIKSIPVEIEEAAMIDGCSPIRTFFSVVFPILKPTAITVSILNVMWVWNDYLLPYMVLDKVRTLPVAIQYLRGGYGSIDMGAMMAMLVLAMLPVIVFYLLCQKYIIEGVVSGAVKG